MTSPSVTCDACSALQPLDKLHVWQPSPGLAWLATQSEYHLCAECLADLPIHEIPDKETTCAETTPDRL